MGQIRTDIKIKLLELGKSAADLANELGVARSTVNYWLNGYNKSGIPGKKFLRILAAFRKWEGERQGEEVPDVAN